MYQYVIWVTIVFRKISKIRKRLTFNLQHNTSECLSLLIRPNKLECYNTLGSNGLPETNTC
jgi:hypothetical protein